MSRVLVAALLVVLSGVAVPAAGTDPDALKERLSAAEGQERVDLLNELAVAVRGNAPEESIEWATEALDLAGRIGDDEGRAQSLNNLGIAHYFLAEYDRAVDYYDRSLAVSERIGDQAAIGNALNNIGVVHFIRGDYDRTIQYYSRALELQREFGDRDGLAAAYNNLGNVFDAAKRYDESLGYYTESISIYREIGDEAREASSLTNTALVYQHLGRYENALAHFEQAFQIAERVDHQPTVAMALNGLGDVADAQHRFDDALDYQNRALAVRRELGDRRGEADTLLSMGQTYTNLAEYGQAVQVLNVALEVASAIEVREIERDAYAALAESHTGLGDFENALDAHRNFKRVYDELFDEEASRRLTELEARSDMLAKDREIESLQARQRLQKLVRNISSASAILLLLLILLLYNRYRLSRRANEALQVAQIEREKAARAELTHVARVSTMGEMASALAHELNQPLTAILSNAETTRRLVAENRATQTHLDGALEDVIIGADRAREIIRRLRKLMRRGEVSRESLSINDVLREVEPFARANVREKGVTLTFDLADGLPQIEGDPIQLQQVALNLVNNGAEAMAGVADGGRLVVSTGTGKGGEVVVAVRDAGPPVDEQVIAGMFQPFFTTKTEGLGMGLAICRTIIEAHHGRLWAERNPDRGLTVRLALPV